MYQKSVVSRRRKVVLEGLFWVYLFLLFLLLTLVVPGCILTICADWSRMTLVSWPRRSSVCKPRSQQQRCSDSRAALLRRRQHGKPQVRSSSDPRSERRCFARSGRLVAAVNRNRKWNDTTWSRLTGRKVHAVLLEMRGCFDFLHIGLFSVAYTYCDIPRTFPRYDVYRQYGKRKRTQTRCFCTHSNDVNLCMIS